MRIRSISLFASTLAALLGCPLDSLTSSGEPPSTEASQTGGGVSFENSAGHDDAVDGMDDVSWAKPAELAPGSAALRVLMTDAPIDADSVFVTVCGIQVHALRPGSSADAGAAGGDRDERDGREEVAPVQGAERSGSADPGRVPPEGGEDPGAPDGHELDDTADTAADGTDDDGTDDDGTDDDGTDDDSTDDDGTDDDGTGDDSTDDEGEREGVDAERPSGEGDDHTDVGGEGDDGATSSDDPAGSGDPTRDWHTVSDQCQTLDLLTLRDGVTEAVGLVSLPAGDYGQIRLMLTEASIVVNGLEQRLNVPSGEQSGIKIRGGFSLRDGEATTLTLDFDAAESVHFVEGQGFVMRPVIRLIDVVTHGERGADAGTATERGPAAPAPRAGRGDAPPPRDPKSPPGDEPREPPAQGEGRAPGAQDRGAEPRRAPPGDTGAGGTGGAGASGG